MTARTSRLLIAAIMFLAACQSGGNVTCSLVGGTQLAPTTWPKFRADVANSGRAAVDLTMNDATGTLLFDGSCFAGATQTAQTCTVGVDGTCPADQTCARIGSISTTPILGPMQATEPSNVYLASSDGTVYVLNPLPLPTPGATPGPIQVTSAILGSPLLGADGTLFVPSNGQLEQFLADGTPKNVAPLVGFAVAAPNIWPVDGTVFVATQNGTLAAVCPNGVPRFAITGPGTDATSLVVQDPHYNPTPGQTPTLVAPIIVVGGVNGQVRAYTLNGNQYWSFSASANIVAALMADLTTNLFYVADTAGRMVAVNLASGQAVPTFKFTTDEFAPGQRPGIIASPALGSDDAAVPTLYVADVGHFPERGGVLYALDRASGEVRWRFPDPSEVALEGPINSSPAVATGADKDVIVFAVDVLGAVDGSAVAIGGKVYAIQDDGDHATLLPNFPFDAGHSIGSSSPAIGIDGRIYIGREGNCLRGAKDCVQDTTGCVGRACVVSEGGALYAIGPTPGTSMTPVPTATPLPT